MDNTILQNVTDILQTFSAWAVSTTAIVAALATVCRPVKKFVSFVVKKVSDNNSNDEVIREIRSVKTELNERMDDMNKRIDAVSTKNDENERDRLKHVIFQYGNIARRQQRISGEEFRYVQDCAEKYKSLGGNGIAHQEMEFITDYYNHQNWSN